LSSNIWIEEDVYSGSTFFDKWDFFNATDPTSYVNRSTAFNNGLAFINDKNQAIMRMDNTSFLQDNGFRDSVRISSQKTYNSGLFILDLTHAPWGCSVWPAFWTVGGNWPNNGEIDVFEGVHDNTHNQMTWHTGPNCNLTVTSNFTGTASVSHPPDLAHTSCFSFPADNSGCAVIDWSRASYGPHFDALNGGVFAMKWDNSSIAIWFFYRQSIPSDITQGAPDPTGWGQPASELLNDGCDIASHFQGHSIVFALVHLVYSLGDWAGSSFGTSGCPGTCGATVQNPSNFVNASWMINSLHVYQQRTIIGVSSAAPYTFIPLGSAFLAAVFSLWSTF
ncbi:glycoside hydrolase family 16 protein, partial [Sphaerobolus stellatus SS14]